LPREFRSGKVDIGFVAVKGWQRSSAADAVYAGCGGDPLQSHPQRFASRLRSSGKHGKQIVAAVMRRLLVLAYGVLKSERPFDPDIGCGRRHSHPRVDKQPSRKTILALDAPHGI
jgi:hypothetical protein